MRNRNGSSTIRKCLHYELAISFVGFYSPEFRVKTKESKVYPQRHIAVFVYTNRYVYNYIHIHI